MSDSKPVHCLNCGVELDWCKCCRKVGHVSNDGTGTPYHQCQGRPAGTLAKAPEGHFGFCSGCGAGGRICPRCYLCPKCCPGMAVHGESDKPVAELSQYEREGTLSAEALLALDELAHTCPELWIYVREVGQALLIEKENLRQATARNSKIVCSYCGTVNDKIEPWTREAYADQILAHLPNCPTHPLNTVFKLQALLAEIAGIAEDQCSEAGDPQISAEEALALIWEKARSTGAQ